MTTSEAAYIQQLLEPTDIIRTGNYKRIPSVMEAKNKAIDEMIASMGIEEYRRRVEEDEQREKQNYHY